MPGICQCVLPLVSTEILQEDATLKWADEKEGADESDKVFLKRSEKLVEWLREAEEEEEEEEDEDRDNHAMAKPWYIFAILFSCG
ncbi:translation initiation factor eIF-2B subunit epsilon-like isoform X2 [Durio zibethinus]|uniref:Translation initiation factor eIF-2B subunit epsilon-like isoform X2 n=1 Tax=Durio zibethinus TaxID=66656 RepID=A0A6P5WTD7_DURZI|nr:translation initiation factor eIF-2B subunit epsilon-like isoform X2 [Durio zibethinus]